MHLNRTLTLVAASCALLVAREAFAFYNPQTGRWLSRDPVQERAERTLYTFVKNDPQDKADLRGALTISHIPRAGETLPCGGFKVDFEFRLDDPQNWAIDGYFVQEIRVTERFNPCNRPNAPGSIARMRPFWEAFPNLPFLGIAWSFDTFYFLGAHGVGATPGSGGLLSWHHAWGEVKFFAKTTTGFLELLWGHGDPSSGDAPSTNTKPTWWDDDEAVEGPASHSVISYWDCCCGKNISSYVIHPQ
jgi:hypothetical protein